MDPSKLAQQQGVPRILLSKKPGSSSGPNTGSVSDRLYTSAVSQPISTNPALSNQNNGSLSGRNSNMLSNNSNKSINMSVSNVSEGR